MHVLVGVLGGCFWQGRIGGQTGAFLPPLLRAGLTSWVARPSRAQGSRGSHWERQQMDVVRLKQTSVPLRSPSSSRPVLSTPSLAKTTYPGYFRVCAGRRDPLTKKHTMKKHLILNCTGHGRLSESIFPTHPRVNPPSCPIRIQVSTCALRHVLRQQWCE